MFSVTERHGGKGFHNPEVAHRFRPETPTVPSE
jgi:hypothetical protein